MNKRLTGILVLFALFTGFVSFHFKELPIPAHFPDPFYDLNNNPLSHEKIELGRALFYDPILSADNSISCASCHSPYNAFAHTDHDLSHGIHDSIGTRNAPALFNLAWNKSFMWDGAIRHLDMQALAPIEHVSEMGSSLDTVLLKLNTSPLYRSLSYKAHQDSSMTGEQLLKALSQFQLTLISAGSKYDRVLNEIDSFTMQEKNGYVLFKKNCATCHSEPLFTNGNFANNGLPLDKTLNDVGRMKITGNHNDAYKFKVPSLRNIEYTRPYMHDGRFETLSEILHHYTDGISTSHSLHPQLKNNIELSDNQKVDMIAFLLTLSDKEFVFDPKHQYPREILLGKNY